MLVLSRKADESIVIGDDVEIVILEVSGKTVNLRIDAPESVRVRRLGGGESVEQPLGKDLSIRIGDDIVLKVLDISGLQAILGIEAPRSIPVHRSEIYIQVKRDAYLSQQGKEHSEPQ